MIKFLFDPFCDFVILFWTTIMNICLLLHRFIQASLQRDSLHKLDATIQRLTDLNLQLQTETPQIFPFVSSPSTNQRSGLQSLTPPQSRRWSSIHQSSIGISYPLPFTLPRTPEEERCNTIIVWVNELRVQHIKQHGNPNENQMPVTPIQWRVDTSNVLHHQSRQNNFRDLNNDELQVLVTLAINALCDRGISYSSSVPMVPKMPSTIKNSSRSHVLVYNLNMMAL